jgi:hypothetical protein
MEILIGLKNVVKRHLQVIVITFLHSSQVGHGEGLKGNDERP